MTYQGETFTINIYGAWARIIDPCWHIIKADDKNLPIIRKTVNEVNFLFGPTIVISEPDNDHNIALHSRMDTIMPRYSIQDTSNYTQSVLKSFFEIKNSFKEAYLQSKCKKRKL